GASQYYLLSSKKPELAGIDVDVEQKTGGLNVKVTILPPDLKPSGEGKIRILHDDEEVYPEHPINIKDGKWDENIDYKSFVIEDGKYTVIAEFANKIGNKNFVIDFVVESITVRAEAKRDSENEVNNIFVKIPLGKTALVDVNVTVDILQNGNIFKNYGNCSLTYIDEHYQYEGLFQYDWSGNYTARATLVNKNVKNNSPYLSREGSWAGLINLAPVAVAKPDKQTTSISDNDGWAYFYGGNSTDYDDNDDDLTFKWYFDVDHDDTQTNETNMNDTRTDKDISYQYMGDDWKDETLPITSADHYVTLEILDKWGRLGYDYTGEIKNVDWCTVTVKK
ncbi:MAG: hypothetical protein QMC80_08170, partial [Thermoplasmatales archaeon]|nr:hypothetical protein [Thermoplasmatales archaeon]